ncbi:CpaE family protein [Phenylobacterium sp.]|jgi:pilus assembly protein CpaE|uniref:CpaE family protein n=1 Tax=Phenylobacterium sp. TaxID=1871053 RepID=UPI002F3E3C5D
MKPQTTPQDPFDLKFEADDDFVPPADETWREAAAASSIDDPFHDIPDPEALQTPDDDLSLGEATGSELVRANPVHELISSAEHALGDAMVPRITIHAFFTTPEIAEVVERATSDRRMEKASSNIRPGGLAAAVETYQNQATPSLVIVESAEAPAELLAGLDALAEVCDPGTKVMVVGAANDIALYRELMRRGVSEYLVPPFDALQLVRSVSNLYADPSAPFVGRQVAFCGAKGGAGASTIAHNVAHSISERLHTGAVLVDLDLPFGTAGLDFNQDPLQGVHDALTQPDRLDPVLMDRMMARCTERLSLFAAPATLDTDYDITPEAFDEVTQKIRASAPFVILDLPHVWTAWKRKILTSSDDLVIVATPDLASLRNAKNMIDLVRRARPNDAPPRLVLNQVGVPGRPEIPAKDFGQALGVTPSAVLAFDAKLFGQAANNGQMLAELAPKSKSAEALDMLAQQITRRDPPAAAPTSFLASLFKRK